MEVITLVEILNLAGSLANTVLYDATYISKQRASPIHYGGREDKSVTFNMIGKTRTHKLGYFYENCKIFF